MLHYSFIVVGVLALVGQPVLEALATAGPAMDYAVALGVAVLLKPWLATHLE